MKEVAVSCELHASRSTPLDLRATSPLVIWAAAGGRSLALKMPAAQPPRCAVQMVKRGCGIACTKQIAMADCFVWCASVHRTAGPAIRRGGATLVPVELDTGMLQNAWDRGVRVPLFSRLVRHRYEEAPQREAPLF